MYAIRTRDYPAPYPHPYRAHSIVFDKHAPYTKRDVDRYISQHAIRGIRGHLREELKDSGRCYFCTNL